MNCDQAKPLLLDYLLEETSPEQRQEVERHAQDCAACSQEIARLQQTVTLLVRGEAPEEIPHRIRLVAEPVGRWAAFWRDSARLAFAGGGLLCLAIALLALFQTTLSYQEGNFHIAFGVPAVAASETPVPAAAAPVAGSRGLKRAEVVELIAAAVASGESQQQRKSELLVQAAVQQAEQQRLRDFREMAESLRYFQAAQTMMWKEQVQSKYLMGTLLRQVGTAPPLQP